MTKSFRLTLIWLLGSFVAAVMSLNVLPASLVDKHYIPVGNDSFYHARRILDAAADPTTFYEFDRKIHVPEGSLLTWPWGYDYGMAKTVRAVMATGMASDPMKVLAYLPVFALLISIGLVVAISQSLGLSSWGTLLATLCVALSPLTQTLHGVGVVDHHFAEFIFILAALCTAIVWMKNPGLQRNAVLAGLVLGIAPAVQNGLFILQLPILIAISILWLRKIQIPLKSTVMFALTLVVTSLLILLPSQPFHEGYFKFYLLSWFHLYIASCTAIAVILMARFSRSTLSVIGILIFASLALTTVLRQTFMGGSFITGQLDILPLVSEARSLPKMIELSGIGAVFEFYSILIALAPISFVVCLWYLSRRNPSPSLTVFLIFCIVGLLLLAMQFRLHVFGSFALFLPMILAVEALVRQRGRGGTLIMSVLSVVLITAYIPSGRQLFAKQIPGNDPSYEPMRGMYLPMQAACKEHPGVVLANSNAGHFIRFHTECSVIANNFLLTPQHTGKFQEVDALMTMTPAELLGSGVTLDYIYVCILDMAPKDLRSERLTLGTPEDLKKVNSPLVAQLLFSTLKSLGPRYQLINELRFPGKEGAAYARFFRILPSN